MRATRCPLHLLALGETLADYGIHRGFRDGRRNRFARAVALAIIDQAVEVGFDVYTELVGGPGKFAQLRIIELQIIQVLGEVLNRIDGAHQGQRSQTARSAHPPRTRTTSAAAYQHAPCRPAVYQPGAWCGTGSVCPDPPARRPARARGGAHRRHQQARLSTSAAAHGGNQASGARHGYYRSAALSRVSDLSNED